MRHYEMMIILDAGLEEGTVQPSLEQFLTVVTAGGGSVDKVDVWGRRRLAYEIDKRSEGIYAVIDMHGHAGLRRRTRPSARPERGGPADQGHAHGAALTPRGTPVVATD